MKLRIRGNSIRLRLLRTEVAALGEKGRVAEAVRFGPSDNQAVTYSIHISKEDKTVSAAYFDNEVRIVLPSEIATRWIDTEEEVGISAEMNNGEGALEILVEKDFACLTRTEDPDNKDAFPNPDSEC